jgi:hypothetical protein
VISSAAGTTLAVFDGVNESDHVGWSSAPAGDVDGDGVEDVILGADGCGGIFCTGPGFAELRSGAGGAHLQGWTGGCDSGLGSAVAGAGDLDEDGTPDVIVGEFARNRAWIYSGATGSTIAQFDGDTDAGLAVAGNGHLRNSPWPAFLVGAPFGSSSKGRVHVVTLTCTGSTETYCTGSPNSVGSGASIGSVGTTRVSLNDFELRVNGCPGGQNGLFFYGPNPISLPFGNGVRCVGGHVARLELQQTEAGGSLGRVIDFDDLPANGRIQAGETWRFQFWYRDPMGGGSRFNLSDGLRADFCP